MRAEPSFEVLGHPAHGTALRPMRDEEADYRLMAKWLTDERVLEWYQGRDEPHPHERIVEKYSPRVLAEDAVVPCFILNEGAPVGYLQYYPVGDAADYELESAEDAWAIDLFIGEPGLWSQGIGGEALRLIISHVVDACGARGVVIDPRIDNPRAIRAYEKVGFRKLRVLAGHELHEGAMRDNWLMVLDRPA